MADLCSTVEEKGVQVYPLNLSLFCNLRRTYFINYTENLFLGNILKDRAVSK